MEYSGDWIFQKDMRRENQNGGGRWDPWSSRQSVVHRVTGSYQLSLSASSETCYLSFSSLLTQIIYDLCG